VVKLQQARKNRAVTEAVALMIAGWSLVTTVVESYGCCYSIYNELEVCGLKSFSKTFE